MRTIIATGLSTLSISALVLGVATMAFAASSDCTGMVKWNGSTSSPAYQWKLDAQNNIIFCPQVTCDDPSKICHTEVGFPEPPSTMFSHNCGCDDSTQPTCSTNVSSPSPWGPIASVNCFGECPEGQDCNLTTVSPKDPNGFYDSRCECR